MKIIFKILFLSLFFSSLQAKDFKLQLWSRDNCRVLDPQCIPQAIGSEIAFQMQAPGAKRFSRKIFQIEDFEVQFFWVEKAGEVPHYIFQTEIRDLEGKTITLCSRYEAIKSLENKIVGACSGRLPDDTIIGVSLLP